MTGLALPARQGQALRVLAPRTADRAHRGEAGRHPLVRCPGTHRQSF